MKKVFLALATAVFAACSSPQTSETTVDSTTLVDPEVNEDGDIVEGSNEVAGADTTLLTTIKSAFKSAQLNSKVAYVYRKDGLPVYMSADDQTTPVDVIPYGEKVFFSQDLINNQPSDNIIFEGFKGRYVAIKNDEGTEMYIFSGYLTNFPVPGQSDGLVDYFGNHLHLVATPQKITSKVMFETTPEWYKTNYQFEGGLVVDDNGYYEGSSTDITLPASCTMQEGFLLLRSFVQMHVYDSVYTQYPPPGFDKSYGEYKNARVESNDDGITRIYIADEGGCIDETYVQKVDGRIVIGTGGGC